MKNKVLVKFYYSTFTLPLQSAAQGRGREEKLREFSCRRQINSRELTDVLVIVVRYFGGIKLGTSGLTGAYRQAASEALEASGKLEKIVMDEVRVSFEYPFMNDVMRIVKEIDVHIVSQSYDMDCQMSLSVRKTQAEALRNRLLKVKSLSVL